MPGISKALQDFNIALIKSSNSHEKQLLQHLRKANIYLINKALFIQVTKLFPYSWLKGYVVNLFKQIIKEMEMIKNREVEGIARDGLAAVLYQKGDYEGAIHEIYKAAQIALSLKEKKSLSFVCCKNLLHY